MHWEEEGEKKEQKRKITEETLSLKATNLSVFSSSRTKRKAFPVIIIA